MKHEIRFSSGSDKLKRRMDTLLSTRAGSVPGDRDFGVSWECLDAPPEVAESLFYQELLTKTERYIPEVRILKVAFEHRPDSGEMIARIECEGGDTIERSN